MLVFARPEDYPRAGGVSGTATGLISASPARFLGERSSRRLDHDLPV